MAEEQSAATANNTAAAAANNTAAAAPLGHSVIPIVNKLQDIFAQLGSQSTIELPQVAVVGSQSSGKSSVLEALVGRDFLPRGNDICTRRPLVLQLVQRKRKNDSTDEEWGEFLHLPGKKFFDFNDIRREIQAETEREAGGNKGVSDKQIRLKIFSPNVLDITLVDLPGLTKVPVGDQPSDIEARIRTMIMSYIKRPSCLILAVTPANSDLANSDALQMAGIADPDGYRTIGVITKLDIMDRGTDARNFLLGKVIPLRLGYVGVVNRSQEDILLNRSIKDALVAEEKFFRSRPVYSDLAERCGVPQLAKKLNQCSVINGGWQKFRHGGIALRILPNCHGKIVKDGGYGAATAGFLPADIDKLNYCMIKALFVVIQILVQHIKTVLPGLKARISTALVSVAKEHASYGEITESKAGQGALLLNILSKYSEAFSSMIEGKNEEMSTSELSGGARIHYIFQNIFVKSLELTGILFSYLVCKSMLFISLNALEIRELVGQRTAEQDVDPCEDLTDDDIRTAIQNATGPKSALFVPEVPFEVLIRRQIARLLDPSLQCARFIYDELIKMSHRCMVNEMQRFPVLRKRMDEVIGNFLREGLEPSETMIGHIIEMEMDYINTSHPNFIGGSKAVEIALQQTKPSRIAAVPRPKDSGDSDKAPNSERSLKSRAILARQANGIVPEQNARPVAEVEKPTPPVNNSSNWGISSIFGSHDNRTSVKENSTSKPFSEPVQIMDQGISMIHLREPPSVLRPSESHSDQEAVEIAVTKLLLRSYYDIVRKNVEDSVPKAIMHFLVNHTKRELHNVFIKKLYRDNLFEEMLQEPDEVATKRKRTRETLRVLQQAFRVSASYPEQTLDELPLEAESVERGYSLSTDPTGLPKIHGLPTSSFYNTSSGSTDSYSASPKNTRPRKSSHSGELHSPYYGDSNGGRNSMLGLYPTADI
ncbi:dynamin [Striga asiatica]|uniref:Dynamin n=1 Tax=Striga asiatica TaxID=4170 RepID=A0A5A7PU93_STRAF|nr:dynamin [Striga asiatica]